MIWDSDHDFIAIGGDGGSLRPVAVVGAGVRVREVVDPLRRVESTRVSSVSEPEWPAAALIRIARRCGG